MSSKKTFVAVAGLAVAVAVIVSYPRGEERPSAPAASKSAATAAKAAPAPAPSAGTPEAVDTPARRSRVRRLADPRQRERILEAIRQARRHRSEVAAGRRAPDRRDEAAEDSEEPSPDPEYIRESVRDILPLLVECYENALERSPELAGKVVVDFTIEGEPDVGGVIGASEIAEGTTIEDDELRECISETMYAIEIDPPTGGGSIRVTYPFEFRSAPPDDG